MLIMLFNERNLSVEFDVEGLQFRVLTSLDEKTAKKVEFTKVTSKSELFRKLYDAGLEICEISKLCNSHYSFVYGVISSSREVRELQKVSKSDEIRKLFSQGNTVGSIAKQLNSNYSFVFSVCKKYKEELNKKAANK